MQWDGNVFTYSGFEPKERITDDKHLLPVFSSKPHFDVFSSLTFDIVGESIRHRLCRVWVFKRKNRYSDWFLVFFLLVPLSSTSTTPCAEGTKEVVTFITNTDARHTHHRMCAFDHRHLTWLRLRWSSHISFLFPSVRFKWLGILEQCVRCAGALTDEYNYV